MYLPCGTTCSVGMRGVPPDLTVNTVRQFLFPCSLGTSVLVPAAGPQECSSDLVGLGHSGSVMSSGLETLGYASDGTAAAKTTLGRYVVPAASESAPGVLVLYVVRTRAGAPRTVPITGWSGARLVQDLGQQLAAMERVLNCSYADVRTMNCSIMFDYVENHTCSTQRECLNQPREGFPAGFLQWRCYPDGYYCHDTCQYLLHGLKTNDRVWRYSTCRYGRELTSASDALAGTLGLDTWGLSDGSEVGEGSSAAGGSFNLSRTISH